MLLHGTTMSRLPSPARYSMSMPASPLSMALVRPCKADVCACPGAHSCKAAPPMMMCLMNEMYAITWDALALALNAEMVEVGDGGGGEHEPCAGRNRPARAWCRAGTRARHRRPGRGRSGGSRPHPLSDVPVPRLRRLRRRHTPVGVRVSLGVVQHDRHARTLGAR